MKKIIKSLIILIAICTLPMHILASGTSNIKASIVNEVVDVLLDSRGDSKVLEAQQWLNKTYGGRYTYTKITEDGVTGNTTVKALTIALQIELGIGNASNGNFGNATAAKCPTLSISKPGSNSNIVRILQHALFCKGYGTYDKYGTFGEQTQAAIKRVEADAGLKQTGVVNAMLFKAILNTDGLVLSGHGDTRVREIQQILNKKYNAYFGIKPCDGVYGRSTNQALIYALQAEEGLPVGTANGNFGPSTTAKCPTLTVGDSRKNYVYLLQYLLYCNGYDPGAFDGGYGNGVKKTVSDYQTFMCLPVTGNADKGTLISLFTSCGDTNRSALACDTSTRLNTSTIATVKNAGYKYIGRYLTNAKSGTLDKKMTDQEIKLILKSGLSIFPIYQTYGGAYSYYTIEQANFDAISAVKAAKNLGIPLGTVIYFAVDYDAYDYQVTEYIIPYFKQLKKRIEASGVYYNIGIYAPRNVCNRVHEIGCVKYCFVGDASKGYSGNLGYRMPSKWAFDQFKTDITIGSGNGAIGIDKVAYSGRDRGFSYQDKSVMNKVVNTKDLEAYRLDFWADPINLATGAHEIDFSAMTVYGAQNIGIELSYSSNGTKQGIFGTGWTYNYESFLKETEDGIDLYQNPSNFMSYDLVEGTTDQYVSTVSGRQTDILSKNSDGSFVLDCNGETKYYYNTQGQLTAEENAAGLKVKITFPSDKELVITDDSSGQSITLHKNESGLVTSISDQNKRNVSLTYNSQKLLTKITDVSGNITTYTYDDAGRVLTSMDEDGVYYFIDSYDESGRVIEQKDAQGSPTYFSYDDSSIDGTLVVTVKDRKGEIRKSTYNEKKQLIELEDQNKAKTIYEYDNNGNLISTKDPLGNIEKKTYDNTNRPVLETNKLGAKTQYSYDENGNLTQIIYEGGDKVTFQYDSKNRKTQMIDLRGTKTTYAYNDDGYLVESITGEKKYTYEYEKGLLKSVADPMGRVTKSEFDEAGNLVQSIDPLGNITKQVNNKAGKVTELTDAMGNTVHSTFNCRDAILIQSDAKGNISSYSYDGNGNVVATTDTKGKVTKYEYDAEDRLVKTTDAKGNITNIIYDSTGRAVGKTDAKGNKTTFEYDLVGNLIKQVSPVDGITTFTYDGEGNVLSKTDADGHKTTYEYDSLSRLIKSTNPMGGSTTYTYSVAGDVTSVTDPLGNKISNTYDPYGNKITSTDANGKVTKYEYDLCDNLIKTIDPLGGVITYTYDDCDRLLAVKDALGNTAKIQYDKNGNVVANIDPLGRKETKEYDENGNVKRVTDPKGNVVSQIAYDALNRPITSTDALGNTSHSSYNEIGELTKNTSTLGQVTTFSYDANGQMISSINAMDGVSKATYNELGKITALVGPLSGTTNYSYDKEGKCVAESTTTGGTITYTYNELDLLDELKNARSQKTNYEYDKAGRVVSYTGLEGTVSYSYDKNGNILTVKDKTGTISREFDALGRVTKHTSAKGETIGYEYDAAGNLVAMIYPDGSQVTYDYDEAYQLIKVTDWNKRVTKYEYDESGNIIRMVRSDGSVVLREYDKASNMKSMTDTAADGTIINQYKYEYDKAARLVKETSKAEQAEYTMVYDDLDRVVSRTKKDLKTQEITEEAFQYDDACNIIASDEMGQLTKMSYDKNNCLKTYNDVALKFDADGNMVSVALNGAQLELGYDSQNRLVKAGKTTYSYDPENHRLSSKEDSHSKNYVYDTLGSQLLMTTDEEGNVVKYIYGIGLIGEEEEGSYREYHYDLRGSTTALTDAKGKVTDRFIYSTYGKVTQVMGSQKPLFLYCGRDGVVTEENGLLYMRFRYYSPELKRFINADVVKGSISRSNTLNPYAYVEGNPITLVDPFGLSAEAGSKTKSTSFWGKIGNGISNLGSKMDLHTALDLAGMVPVIGEACDAINAVYYLSEGDYINAAFSAASIIPMSDVFTKTGKLAVGKGFKTVPKPYTNSRPSYRKGVVDEVWERAKGPDGLVRDPNTGDIINYSPGETRKGVWDMGHIPGEKYSDMHDLYMNGDITKGEFLDWFNDPNNYRPELPSNNRSHKYE